MTTPAATMGLLLADPVDLRPTLAAGLPDDAANGAPQPPKAPRSVDALSLDAPDADPNDLPLQRWGVIAPLGAEGDAALEAIAPLIRLREAEQGAKAKIYRDAPVDGTLERAAAWKNEVWGAEEESERPRYLLVLGDADQHGFELQHALASGAFVGRLHADTPEGYAAYAEKVVRWARSPHEAAEPDALFFVAEDDTEATAQGRAHLVEPCLSMARAGKRFPVASVVPVAAATRAELLTASRRGRPSVLLSVSHGLGRPRGGWQSPAEQRTLQGALLVNPEASVRDDRLITAEHLQGGPFLPGGLWFCLACFGAGTPQRSAFYPWLDALQKAGAHGERVTRVLDSLPAAGEKPFVAAMPKAALANPDGPLAVVGHVDLAWTYGFVDQNRPTQSRAERLFSAVRAMVRGSRAGVGLDALMRAYREVNDELLAGYQAEADAQVWNRPSPVDRRRRGSGFMLRNDLRGYVLLGDPAARLPLHGSGAVERALRASGGAAAVHEVKGAAALERGARDPAEMEQAVLAMLQGEESPRAIAARHGVALGELHDWVETYRVAGRAALGRR